MLLRTWLQVFLVMNLPPVRRQLGLGTFSLLFIKKDAQYLCERKQAKTET